MIRRSKALIACAVALLSAGFLQPASAQTMIEVSITGVRTGWNSDSFALETAEPIRDPANCGNRDGYITSKAFPGYETYYAAALTAITTRRRSVVVVHNSECVGNRPKLIGINLRSN